MPEEAQGNEGNSAPVQNNQTVNLGGDDPSEISMLKQFRNKPSSGKQDGQANEGESSSETGQGGSNDNREPAIPRDRFDQVNTQKNQLQQQNQQLQQQMAAMQQFLQAQQQPQQGAYNPTGMVGQQPQPQQQQQQNQNLPNFDDPEVQKEWRKKLGDNPIKGMVEMFQALLQKEGAPMLQQAIQQVQQQIQPVQQAYVQQAVSQYAQQRANQDPQFQQIQPAFQNVVSRALQERPNLQLNPQTLQVLESVARVQAQNQPQPQGQVGFMGPQLPQFQSQNQQTQGANPPFTERPGGQAPQGQQGNAPVQLTAQERMIARTFNMTDEQYAKRKEGMTRG